MRLLVEQNIARRARRDVEAGRTGWAWRALWLDLTLAFKVS